MSADYSFFPRTPREENYTAGTAWMGVPKAVAALEKGDMQTFTLEMRGYYESQASKENEAAKHE